MTEEQAKSKWCPMVRAMWLRENVPENTITGFNRETGDYNCIASDCMMWRWTKDSIPYGYCGLGNNPVKV